MKYDPAATETSKPAARIDGDDCVAHAPGVRRLFEQPRDDKHAVRRRELRHRRDERSVQRFGVGGERVVERVDEVARVLGEHDQVGTAFGCRRHELPDGDQVRLLVCRRSELRDGDRGFPVAIHALGGGFVSPVRQVVLGVGISRGGHAFILTRGARARQAQRP